MAATESKLGLPRQPSPPNPSEDAGLVPQIGPEVNKDAIPSPPVDGHWDVTTLQPDTAMKMLARVMQALADGNEEVPPTSPTAFVRTGNRLADLKSIKENYRRHHRRVSSRPATPVPDDDIKAPGFRTVDVGSPEACDKEPATAGLGDDAVEHHIQCQYIARKFFSKASSPVTIEEYLVRLHRYCPMSTAVYLAAATYIFKLCIEERLVPCVPRTIHRLVLGTLRVAMKALEDLRYPQARFAGVGGVRETELHSLEIAVCYLTNFDLQVNSERLYRRMLALQQSAAQASLITGPIAANEMKLEIPLRVKANAQTA